MELIISKHSASLFLGPQRLASFKKSEEPEMCLFKGDIRCLVRTHTGRDVNGTWFTTYYYSDNSFDIVYR